MRQTLGFILLIMCGCQNAMLQPRYAINVRGLQPPEPPADVRGGVTIAAQAITRADWKQHPDITINLQWQASDTAQTPIANATGSRQSSGVTSDQFAVMRHIENADVALLPLPSFIVRIVNQTGRALPLANARIALTDGLGHRYEWTRSRTTVLKRAENELLTRYPVLGEPDKPLTLETYRRAQSDLKILSSDTEIASGADIQAYVAFDLDVKSLDEMRLFMTRAKEVVLEFDLGSGGEPFRFAFALDRKQPGVLCADGKRRATLSECPNQYWATEPADDGPCIQSTKKQRVVANINQWWIGGVPVANSDLHRTLLADSITHDSMQRALRLQWSGYALIGGGLLTMAVVPPVLSAKYGFDTGVYGLTAGVAAIAGIVLVALGNRAHDRAIRVYNQQADVTGLCSVVW